MDAVTVNRTPVLTLWAAVVAERRQRAKKARAAGVLRVALLGRAVPVLRTAMEKLENSRRGALSDEAFRPKVPKGESGRGVKGSLSLKKIWRLAEHS